MTQSLPVSEIANDLADTLLAGFDVVLTAPTGSGKSTLLPLLLLQRPEFKSKRLLMLEPRRLAATSVAQFMAQQLGEQVGQQVGYQIRQQQKRSAETRLMVVTEGILTRLLQQDPELSDYDMVIFDECHERNLYADLAFALCLDAQQGLRDDLRLLMMSATMDVDVFHHCLPQARHICCEGRQFPVQLHYRMRDTKHAWLPQCFALLKQALVEQSQGDVLVFLPGLREIKQLQQWAEQEPELATRFEWLPLYGDLPNSEQQRIFHPSEQRRVILATNIAETSITLPRVRTVVDSGFERSMRFVSSANTGKLVTKQISRASAQQRSGRAGRVAAGHSYRLWSEQQQQSFEPTIVPEVSYADLTQMTLELAQWGVTQLSQLSWLTTPNHGHWQHAQQHLRWLGAIDGQGNVNNHGRAMLKLGLAPRLAHLLVLAAEQHDDSILATTCLAAALLEEKSNQRNANFLSQFDLSVKRLGRQSPLLRQAQQWFKRAGGQHWPNHYQPAALVALFLTAFPDRVAKRRQSQEQTSSYSTSDGIGVQLPQDDALQGSDWLLVLQHQLSEHHADSWIRAAIVLEPALINDQLAHLIMKVEQVSWDEQKGKVIGRCQQKLGQLVIASQPMTTISDHHVEQALCGWVQRKGLKVLNWTPAVSNFCQRVNLAKAWQLTGTETWPEMTSTALQQAVEQWLLPYLAGLSSQKALQQLDVLSLLRNYVGYDACQTLDVELPTHFETPLNRQVAIEYDADAGAKVSVPMQEMYGCNAQVMLAGGRCPLTFELLSPAKRPIQLTKDLPQFWQGSYREVQKEMKGRYPKHLWPDDPAHTEPTRKTKRHL